MFDSLIRPVIDPPLNRTAETLIRANISADMMTWFGFVFGLAACVFLIDGYYDKALICLFFNRLADGLDGAIARASSTGTTDRGAFLDIVFDFIIYAGLPFCMAFHLANYQAWAATAFLLFTFVCSGISFMAFALMAEKRGITTDVQGKKGFYYLAGIAEGAETIVFLALICLWPDYFVPLAWGFGVLCLISTLGRVIVGIKKLS